MAKGKKKTSVATQRAIDDLVDAVVESLRVEYHGQLEPVEAYTQRVRERLHADVMRFRQRFHHGYEVLQAELDQENARGKS